MVHSRLSPYVRVALDYTIPSYWPFRERVIFDFELLLVKEGEVMITHAGSQYHCRPGDFFLIKPGKTHMMKPVGDVPLRHPHIHFDAIEDQDSERVTVNFAPLTELSPAQRALIRQDILSVSPFLLPEHIRLHSSLLAEEMLFEIISEVALKRPLYQERCKGLITTLLVHLAREIHSNAALDKPAEQRAVEHTLLQMRAHLHEPLSLDALAHESGYSKSLLSYLFHQALGMPPVKYHQHLRLEEPSNCWPTAACPSAPSAICVVIEACMPLAMRSSKPTSKRPSIIAKRCKQGLSCEKVKGISA